MSQEQELHRLLLPRTGKCVHGPRVFLRCVGRVRSVVRRKEQARVLSVFPRPPDSAEQVLDFCATLPGSSERQLGLQHDWAGLRRQRGKPATSDRRLLGQCERIRPPESSRSAAVAKCRAAVRPDSGASLRGCATSSGGPCCGARGCRGKSETTAEQQGRVLRGAVKQEDFSRSANSRLRGIYGACRANNCLLYT